MVRLHDKIRRILDQNPHLTQRGLAERMGLDPAAVNRMLNGRRGIMAEEIPVIEAYLGQRLDLHEDPAAALRPRGLSDVPQADMVGLPDVMTPVPVRDLQGGMAPIDWIVRHPAQAGIRQAFALYMPDDSMAPRYFSGEVVYVHPHRPAAPPQDVVIGFAGGSLQLCRLLDADAQTLQVRFFNPPHETSIARKDVAVIYTVVGRG